MAAQVTGACTTRPRCCSPTAVCSSRAAASCRAATVTNELNARDLLAAVPLQGRAADDHERAVDGPVRLAASPSRRPNAASIASVSLIASRRDDARDRTEPALHAAQLHARERHADRAGAGEREHRAARLLHALHRRHERRPVGRSIVQRFPAPRGHDGADGAGRPRARPAARARRSSPGRRRPTTSASTRYNVYRSTTTRLHAVGREPDRRSRRHDATPTRPSRPAPTTTGRPRRTRPATSRPAASEARRPSTADTTPPTVSLTAPAPGATVSVTVAVTANASDNGAVAGVQFKLDGANLGAEDTTAPYSISWDTTTAANGSHTLTAVARDAAGNTTIDRRDRHRLATRRHRPASSPPTGSTRAAARRRADQSGNGNTGTLAGATWAGATAGKFGNALIVQRHERVRHGRRLELARPDDRR